MKPTPPPAAPVLAPVRQRKPKRPTSAADSIAWLVKSFAGIPARGQNGPLTFPGYADAATYARTHGGTPVRS